MVKWKSKEKDTVAKPVLTWVAPVEEESFLQIHKQYMSEGNDLISLIKLHLCEKLLIVLISILFLLLLFDSRELKSLQLHAIYLQFFIFAYGLTVLVPVHVSITMTYRVLKKKLLLSYNTFI